ncbi:MAG: hypothetical protein K0Q43_5441 [Ramlibacter sp.]|jgi:hypothetical protein|nr:hypothetical protein [Ramlibacter sp.]
MHTDTHRLADQHLLMDAARRHAAQLRADAIDEFWSSAGDAARRALRSTRRLAASLARHQRLRAQQPTGAQT